jgi:hypothetical protein
MTMRLSARQFFKRPATRSVRTAPRRLWLMDKLENRLMLAQFTDASPALMLTLAANDAVAVMATPSTYTLNLTSGSWNGTDDANVSGNGTATLTVQKSTFNQVSLTDTGAGTSVTFNDSGLNSYASNFSVALTNAAAGSIAFNGATSFTGSNALGASTSAFIVANSGAAVTTASGGITLSANQQTPHTGGTFVGININGATVQSATGAITLAGAGGTTGINNYGVEIQAGGKVQETGGPGALISVTGSADDSSSAAVMFATNGAVSTLGFVKITANGGSISEGPDTGPDVTAGDGATFTTTGTNSAIGTLANPIKTAIGALTATTNDGGVYISDSNAPGLIINSVLAKQGGFAPTINAQNQIVVINTTTGNTTAATNDVSVTATGDILFASAAGVSTTVAAPHAVTINSIGGRILQGQPGTDNVLAQSVSLKAGGSIGLMSDAVGLTVENFSASATNGSIFLAELIPGTALSVVAGGAGNNASVTGSGATLGIGTVSAPGSVTVLETGGALLRGTSMNITGQTVNLTGKSGIGTVAAPFTVTASNLIATITDPGVPLEVTNTTALSSVSATTNNGDAAIMYTGGSLLFAASTGLLTASGAATVSFDNTGGDVVLGAVNVASIIASGAIIAAPSVDLTGGTVTLTAGTGIGALGSRIKTNVTTLNATTTSGNIIITQTGGFTLNARSTAFTDPLAKTGSDIIVSTTGDMTVGAASALGTVALGAGGAILAGSPGTTNAFNVSGDSVTLTAGNGIGTSGVLQTSVKTLTADGGTGGVFLSNSKALKLVSASATGGDVSITTLGDLNVGSVTAPGQTVTLSATGALIDPSGPELNVTAQSAILSGSSIGSSSDPFETQVSSLTATGTSGAIHVGDLGTGTITLTATATGLGANINVTSLGSIVLNTVTAQGNTVTLNAVGSITNGLGLPGVNITAQTLSIVAPGSLVVPGGIGTLANPLEILVAQIATADGGTYGVFMENAGAVSITAGTLTAPGTGTLTFDAASITIQDLGTVSLAAGRSLVLKTKAGPIVFLNQTNTIQTSGGGTITVEAGMTAGSGGVAVLGNLTTGGGAINVTADGNITIGQLNATGTGSVTVQSANGIILDGNGSSTVNVIAGTTTLSGNAPTARQLQLKEENAIATAAAAAALASADQTTADAFNSQLPIINNQVTTLTATAATDHQAALAADQAYLDGTNVLNGLNLAVSTLTFIDLGIDVGVLVALAVAGPAQAVPIIGDVGANTIYAVLQIVEAGARLAVAGAQVAANAYAFKVTQLGNADVAADILDGTDNATLQAELLTQLTAEGALQIAQAAAGNALLQSETAQVLANQAIAATNQGNVIGSIADPLGISAAMINVSAGPTDSVLEVVGGTALGQINATGSVTLISTGAITNGALPGVANIQATGLTITAVGGIGTGANPLLTRVGTLNATNTGSGDIVISDTAGTPAALNITGISNTASNVGSGNVVITNKGNAAAGQGITVSGPISTTEAGSSVTINSGSPLTIAANVTSASGIILSAGDTSASGDDLMVNPGVTIQSTGSTVTLQAGDNVTVPIGSTIQAAGAITITADLNSADTVGANVVVEGTLIAPSASIEGGSHNDTFTITPSGLTPITVDGGLGNDTLNFNADGLPVTIQGNTITALGDQAVTFLNVEAVHILNAAGGGSVTLKAAGVADLVVLTGTGQGAGTFTENGGIPISFSGVTTFAYVGGNQNDAITVSPFATSLQQWKVAVKVDGGSGQNSLTLNGVSGVSENITVQPSAPGAGQLIDTNGATGASVAVINYVNNNNIVVNGSNGSTGATDNLFINGTDAANPGTSGNDDALANFQAVGDVTHPMVRIYDAGAGSVGGRTPSELADTAGAAANDLFNLQSLTNFSTIHIGLLGGNDVLDLLAGAASGAVAINYTGGTGDDSLIVDSTNGPVLGPINYDGGPGTNSMTLTGGTATSDTYTPGSQLGTGTNTLVFSGGTESVSFQNLAPIFDQVAGPLSVNANNANNAITYQEGNGTTNTASTAWGQVSVDTLEPINFTNKSALTVNGLAGTDTFSLNNPNTPTGLASIVVSGSGSTGSDALIVNGVATTVAVAVDTKTITGATGTGGAVPITYDTFGTLTVNAGPSTTLAIKNSNTFIYTPGSTADTGTVQTSTLPISFTGLGAGKTLALTGLGALASLVANDPTANDIISVAATSGNVTLAGRATITTASISNLTLNGLTGVDTFNVTGPLPYTSTTLAGGGAGVANLNGNGTAMTANLGGVTASVSGGGLGTVALPGIGILNLNAGAGNITLAGTAGSDAFTVTPTGLTTATAQVGALSPVVNTTNTGFSTLTVDAGAGSNTLTVNGTSGSDVIAVGGAAVTVTGLKPVQFANVVSVLANGSTGSDTFNVTSSATVPISIDGGDPIGVLPGDQINILTNPGDTAALFPGPTSDQGGFVVNTNQPVSFVHIESMSVSGGGTPVINGTNGNDVIAIVARDSSYASGLDGIQDFTVSVNSGPNLLFVNTSSVKVNAGAGNDQIILQAPAPNLAAWNVTVTIDGGVPSINDQLVVIAPGKDQAAYTPASFNSGALVVNNGVALITNVTFTNIESFSYDGQSGGDTFTMVGTSGANAFTLTPGATNDAGTLSMDSTLPVTFQNLGTLGQVVVNGTSGADSLVYNGTAANDTFVIKSSALGGEVDLNARVPVLTQNIPTVSLEGRAGDDTFTLVPTILTSPYTTLNLDGGATASATGNQANLTAAASSALTISGQTIKQGGKTVAGTSLQNINLNGAGNNLTYNAVAGVTETINVIASPTAGLGQLSVPNVALWSFTAVPVVYVNDVIGNAADNDTLTFTGTNNSDVYQIHLEAAGTNLAPVLQLQDATAHNLLTLGNYSGFGTLNVSGLDGADTYNVYTAATVADPNSLAGRNLFINGNLPSGKKKLTNVLHIFYAPKRPTIVQTVATQNPTSGQVQLNYGAALFLIGYAGIQNVTIAGK